MVILDGASPAPTNFLIFTALGEASLVLMKTDRYYLPSSNSKRL